MLSGISSWYSIPLGIPSAEAVSLRAVVSDTGLLPLLFVAMPPSVLPCPCLRLDICEMSNWAPACDERHRRTRNRSMALTGFNGGWD